MTTKVYYYKDDDTTPFVVEIGKRIDTLTLCDFKKEVPSRGSKYYVKMVDQDFKREVKCEIVNDHDLLYQSTPGPIELFVVTNPIYKITKYQENGTITRKKEKRHSIASNDYWKKSYKPHYANSYQQLSTIGDFEESHTRKNNCSPNSLFYESSAKHKAMNNSESTGFSSIAGDVENSLFLKPYPKNKRNFDIQSQDDIYSEFGEQATHRKRKPRQNNRRRQSPSTDSSTLNSSMTSHSTPCIEVVNINLKEHPFLGIKVVGNDGGIFICDVDIDGAAYATRKLEVGDQIIQLDEYSFEDLSEDQAAKLLKSYIRKKRNIKLFISKRKKANAADLNLYSGLNSTILPCDISCWVETALERQKKGIDKTYLEKEIMEYNQNELPQTSSNLMNTKENICYNPSLSCTMGHNVIIQHILKPASGLQIKDRKWLKISVPNSFIGADLVTYLRNNVTELKSRKEAQRYASWMLKQKHIHHMIENKTFTEKGYYTFNESFIKGSYLGENNRRPIESRTEVTYCTASSSNNLKDKNEYSDLMHPTNYQQDSLNNAGSVNHKWPVPPTPSSDKSSKIMGSAFTEDYASLIGMDDTIYENKFSLSNQKSYKKDMV